MKALAIIALVLTLASCHNFMELDYTVELPKGVDTLEAAYFYASSMTYLSDSEAHGSVEYWQAPGETMDRRTGDCEDFAILFSSLADELGYHAEVVFCFGHCVSRIDGTCYDPTPVLTADGCKADSFVPVEVEIELVYSVADAVRVAVEKYGSY